MLLFEPVCSRFVNTDPLRNAATHNQPDDVVAHRPLATTDSGDLRRSPHSDQHTHLLSLLRGGQALARQGVSRIPAIRDRLKRPPKERPLHRPKVGGQRPGGEQREPPVGCTAQFGKPTPGPSGIDVVGNLASLHRYRAVGNDGGRARGTANEINEPGDGGMGRRFRDEKGVARQAVDLALHVLRGRDDAIER